MRQSRTTAQLCGSSCSADRLETARKGQGQFRVIRTAAGEDTQPSVTCCRERYCGRLRGASRTVKQPRLRIGQRVLVVEGTRRRNCSCVMSFARPGSFVLCKRYRNTQPQEILVQPDNQVAHGFSYSAASPIEAVLLEIFSSTFMRSRFPTETIKARCATKRRRHENGTPPVSDFGKQGINVLKSHINPGGCDHQSFAQPHCPNVCGPRFHLSVGSESHNSQAHAPPGCRRA